MTTPRTPQESGTPGTVASTPRSRYSRRGPGLVARFAAVASVSEQHASQLVYGTNNLRDRVVKLIHCFHAAGKEAELRAWLEPIEDAKTSRIVPAFTPRLLLEAQAAESKADAERLRFVTHPAEERAAWLKALRAEIAELQAVEAAVANMGARR